LTFSGNTGYGSDMYNMGVVRYCAPGEVSAGSADVQGTGENVVGVLAPSGACVVPTPAPTPAHAGNKNASGSKNKAAKFPLNTVLILGGGVVGVGLLAWIVRSVLKVWRDLKEEIATLKERVTVLEGGGAGASSMIRSLPLHEIGRQHGRGGAWGAHVI